MSNLNPQAQAQPNYDPRWFVWAIVFLMATGVSLVTYIMVSSADDGVGGPNVVTHQLHKR